MNVPHARLIVLILPLLVGCPQPVDAPASPPSGSHTLAVSPEARLMGVLDINEDGWLSSAEVRAVSRKGAWTQMDVSRDGKVDLVELRRFLDNENPIKPMLEKRRDLKMMSKRHKVFKGKSQTRTPTP